MVAPRTSPLEHIRSVQHLVPFLGMGVEQLESLSAGMMSTALVRTVNVTRGGKTRRITRATSEQLRNVHRRILAMLTALSSELPPHVNGYVRGRSIGTNASVHAGHRYLQKFDFVEFFSHVQLRDVSNGLQHFGVARDAADLMASLTTVGGRLPVGFSTSPALANVSMYRLDEELFAFATERQLSLSRYADDLAFSGQDPFDVELDIRALAARHGQELNVTKTKKLKHGQPLYVTGLSTSAEGIARLPRPMKRALRQQIHYIDKYGLHGHAMWRQVKPEDLHARVAGLLSYARSIEPEWVEGLLEAHDGVREVLFPKTVEVAVKRRARLSALAERVRDTDASRPEAYEPAWTYGSV